MATTKFAIAPMKAAQVPKPGADFEIVERDIPNPDAGQVRIKVQACGVCHSDVLTKDGFPGINYPRVPGHEVAGVIDELGAGVSAWKKGSRISSRWSWQSPPPRKRSFGLPGCGPMRPALESCCCLERRSWPTE